LTTQAIVQELLAVEEEKPVKEITPEAAPRVSGSGVWVLGSNDMVTRMAQCCHPVPGDNIIGYITRSRGVTIHCQDCYNVIHEDEKERLIPVDWGKTEALYPVKIQVEAIDRVGLMRDISEIVATEKVNISMLNLINHEDRHVTLYFTLETRGLSQLSGLLAKIESIRGITSVARVSEEAKKS
jgi:guanosine-3',5'-bis(diphosphate) 3'-pyrophosphohydrolase